MRAPANAEQLFRFEDEQSFRLMPITRSGVAIVGGWARIAAMLLPLAGGSGAVVKLGEFMMILELHRQGAARQSW